jgi:endonuclease YncB( thermonuclease family)
MVGTVAEIFSSLDGVEKSLNDNTFAKFINQYFCQAYCPSYVKKCPNVTVFEQAQKIAKGNKAGVWNDLNAVPPWEFRKQKR